MLPRARPAVLLAAVVAALLTTPATGRPRAEPGPDSHRDPIVDGCQRSQALILAVSSPEWVYVHSAAVRTARLTGDTVTGTRVVHGTVAWSRPAGEDLYLSHDYNDMNFAIRPDAADAGILANGNLASTGIEKGVIETEWEASKIPTWAWPYIGDRVWARGSWIWDCGHWGNGAADDTHGISPLLPGDPDETVKDLQHPGTIRGETTELHPLDAVAITRHAAAGQLTGVRQPRLLSQLDVWVNGDGGPARSVIECATLGNVSAIAARSTCAAVRDVGGDYAYTLPVGPPPTAHDRLVVNPVVVRAETDAALAHVPVTVVPQPDQRAVTVRFTLPHTSATQRFGISIQAGWAHAPVAIHHRIRLDNLTVRRSLDGASETNNNPFGVSGEQTPGAGEWVLYAMVSGHWVQLPGLTQVDDGQVVPLGITLDIDLPRGVAPVVLVSGHECDEPILDCTHEHYGATAADAQPSTELGFNDRPGRIALPGVIGVPMRPGRRAYAPPVSKKGEFTEDKSDANCGGPCYTLTATWTTNGRPGSTGAPAPGSGAGSLASTGGIPWAWPATMCLALAGALLVVRRARRRGVPR